MGRPPLRLLPPNAYRRVSQEPTLYVRRLSTQRLSTSLRTLVQGGIGCSRFAPPAFHPFGYFYNCSGERRIVCLRTPRGKEKKALSLVCGDCHLEAVCNTRPKLRRRGTPRSCIKWKEIDKGGAGRTGTVMCRRLR